LKIDRLKIIIVLTPIKENIIAVFIIIITNVLVYIFSKFQVFAFLDGTQIVPITWLSKILRNVYILFILVTNVNITKLLLHCICQTIVVEVLWCIKKDWFMWWNYYIDLNFNIIIYNNIWINIFYFIRWF